MCYCLAPPNNFPKHLETTHSQLGHSRTFPFSSHPSAAHVDTSSSTLALSSERKTCPLRLGNFINGEVGIDSGPGTSRWWIHLRRIGGSNASSDDALITTIQRTCTSSSLCMFCLPESAAMHTCDIFRIPSKKKQQLESFFSQPTALNLYAMGDRNLYSSEEKKKQSLFLKTKHKKTRVRL